MLIRWKGELVRVEFIDRDEVDTDMPLLVRFPEGHEMRGPDDENDGTVWLTDGDFEVIEDGGPEDGVVPTNGKED